MSNSLDRFEINKLEGPLLYLGKTEPILSITQAEHKKCINTLLWIFKRPEEINGLEDQCKRPLHPALAQTLDSINAVKKYADE